MYFELTQAEKRNIQVLEEAYAKLLAEADEKAAALRSKDPEPDPKKLAAIEKKKRALYAKRPKEPTDPAEIEAYHETKAYKEWYAKVRPLEDEYVKVVDDWYDAGSEEWYAARAEYIKLEKELAESRQELLNNARRRYVASLGDDPEKVYQDACWQVGELIARPYFAYENDIKLSTEWRAYDVRVLPDGSFKLDIEETRKRITEDLALHFEALRGKDGYEDRLTVYIDQATKTSPYTSSEGTLFGAVRPQEEKSLTATRPREYKRPNNKSHNLLFKNELTTNDANHFEPVGLNRQKSVIVYANFVPPRAAEALGLDDYDERVYAAVGSCILAGNTFIPFSMLYNRGMMGLSPSTRGNKLTPAIEADIIKSLSMFDGRITLTNDPTGERAKADPNFATISVNEPLLFYQLREEKVHGQITRGIAVPSSYVPVGYRIAEANRNELLTDRIESIHVDGLNYSRDNLIIANATYKQVKRIQYENEKKRYNHELPENRRTITYALVAERMRRDFETMSPTERNRLKNKIDACMKSYQKSGHFYRYEHKRDATKTFYAVVLYFDEPKKLR